MHLEVQFPSNRRCFAYLFHIITLAVILSRSWFIVYTVARRNWVLALKSRRTRDVSKMPRFVLDLQNEIFPGSAKQQGGINPLQCRSCFPQKNCDLMQRSMGNFVRMQMQFNWTLGWACWPWEGAGVRRLILLQVVGLTLRLIVI